MRLISQYGTIDVSYENVAVIVNGNYIGVDTGSRRFSMANYATEEKADKVMDMLHEAYLVPQMEDGNNLHLGFVFQFPADDEVEV